jgi:hypothetical protein
MNIFSTNPGDFVEFDTIEAGLIRQQKDVQKRLAMNCRYEVKEIKRYRYCAEVHLVGFDEPFNTVFFNNVSDFTGFKLKR